MFSKKIIAKIESPKDIAKIVHSASSSTQCVSIQKGNATVDAKSILGVFSLGIVDGEEVVISSEDEKVLDKIEKEFGNE